MVSNLVLTGIIFSFFEREFRSNVYTTPSVLIHVILFMSMLYIVKKIIRIMIATYVHI